MHENSYSHQHYEFFKYPAHNALREHVHTRETFVVLYRIT